jgi:RNA polymerase sigma factor (sigma-70 family)
MVEFDRQAWFAQQILVHEGRLRSFLRRYFRTPSDVADGIQETYARLLSLPDRELNAIRSPHAFLFTAARNLALEWSRRERLNFREFLPETGATCVLDESPSAYELLGVRQELELLGRAIARLPARCREVLILRKLYGLSQKEIAARLGITENTVEKHAANGVRLCAAYLGASLHGQAGAPADEPGRGRGECLDRATRRARAQREAQEPLRALALRESAP